MASSPNYATTPRAAVAQASVANANRDGTGTLATVFTAGASGSRIDAVNIQAVSATTFGMLRLYLHDGTNARLFHEMLVNVATPSATAQAFNAAITFAGGILLPSGWSLRASTEKGETFNVFAFGGDF